MKEAFVSFELAKLLKEKGFDEVCWRYWSIPEQEMYGTDGIPFQNNSLDEDYCTAPTHQMACAWLREIYDLHIIAYPFKSGNNTSTKHYCCQVFKTFNLLGYEKYTNETLTSYEEAVEIAIKYCLENLIK